MSSTQALFIPTVACATSPPLNRSSAILTRMSGRLAILQPCMLAVFSEYPGPSDCPPLPPSPEYFNLELKQFIQSLVRQAGMPFTRGFMRPSEASRSPSTIVTTIIGPKWEIETWWLRSHGRALGGLGLATHRKTFPPYRWPRHLWALAAILGRKTQTSTRALAAAGEGAISAGQLGPHRQCSMAVSGPSDAERETGFKENHVGGNDGRSAVPGRVFLPVCRDKRN